jgi:hypothetical protein
MEKQINPDQAIQIQVTSINGSQSTIKFAKRKTGGFGLENEHKTNKSKLGERDFKLLKQNRVLLDLLYVQRFIGWLKDTYGINFLELTPQAWCEIISVLLEQPKTMKERNGIVTYSYSNKTYAYAHFFDLLFGSFQDLDKEGTMRTLRTLKDQSTKDYLRYNKKSLLLTKELEIESSLIKENKLKEI